MLQYDGDLLVPTNHLVAPPSIDHTLGEYLCATGLKSFAVSETQKFGHVTFSGTATEAATSTKHSRPTSRSRPTMSNSTPPPR